MKYAVPWLMLVIATACGSFQTSPMQSNDPAPPARQRLPTVTPIVAPESALGPPTATPAVEPQPTLQPTGRAAAEATASVAATSDPTSLEQLNLGPEPYATLGDPAAPITMVVFSDFGCPYCRAYELFTFPEIRTRYIETGKVYYVYKDFPIVSIQGTLAAQAAECSGEQGRYWEMHRQLFLDPAEWDATPEKAHAAFKSYATALDMDAALLEQCLMTDAPAQEVDQDFQEGQALRLQATPSFLINGKLLIGMQPTEVFMEVLEEAGR